MLGSWLNSRMSGELLWRNASLSAKATLRALGTACQLPFHVSELNRGDITWIADKAASNLDLFAPGIMLNPLTGLPRAVDTINREMVLPVLADAFKGEGAARERYLDHRIFGFSMLPRWAQQEIYQFLALQFESVDFARHIPKRARCVNRGPIKVRAPSESAMVRAFCLEGFVTWRGYERFVARLAELDFGRTSAVHNRFYSDGLVEVFTYFSPIAQGYLGNIARHRLPYVAKMMLRARLLNDLLSHYDISLSEQRQLEIFRNTSDPWKLMEARSVRRLLQVSAQLAGEGIVDPRARAVRFDRALSSSPSTSGGEASIPATSPMAPGVPNSAEGRAAGSSDPLPSSSQRDAMERDAFIAGVVRYVSAFHPSQSRPPQVARKLYNLSQRGAGDYLSITRALQLGVTPEELVGRLYREHLRPLKESSVDPLPLAAPAPTPVSAGSVEAESNSELEFLRTGRKTPFFEWLDSLDRRTRGRIENALGRLSLGSFRDVKRIVQVDHPMFEMRLPFGPHYRIYFERLGSRAVVIWGGIKATQERDILKSDQLWSDQSVKR